MSTSVHKSALFRRGWLLLLLCLIVVFAVCWLKKPDGGSGYIVGGHTVSYDYYDTTSPPKAWKALARMDFNFTNPTTRSVWFIHYPRFNMPESDEWAPAVLGERRKTLGQYWHEKTSKFPQGLKTSWSLWTSDATPLTLFPNEPLYELRPKESIKIRVTGVLGRPQRVGVICRERADDGTIGKWTTNWSAVFTPTK